MLKSYQSIVVGDIKEQICFISEVESICLSEIASQIFGLQLN
jgi:hypothetical protein